MQTFLPHPSFVESARVLDRSRLGKQRVETLQIMQRLLGCRIISRDKEGRDLPSDDWSFEAVKTSGWSNHPAVLMWRGHHMGLLLYQMAITDEWVARGYRDTCMAKTARVYHYGHQQLEGVPALPDWLGNEDFHLSHQSNLLRKDPEFYGPKFPRVDDSLEYVWPSHR